MQVELTAGERVQVALHLAFAGAGFGPGDFLHLELGEGGLLGLEDLRELAHPVITHVHRGDVTLAPALGESGHQRALATAFESDDARFHRLSTCTCAFGYRRPPASAQV